MGASIQPREATAKHFYIKTLLCKVGTVYVGYFQLTTLGGFNPLGYFNHTVVVKIQPGYGIAGFWLGWLLFNADGASVSIELHHAKTLWIGYVVAEYGCAFCTRGGGMQIGGEVLAVENIIAED